MSDVSADIRIFPNKEMFSIDMAEITDAAMLRDGIIQGCAITLTAGSLTIADGRIVIKGRLAVITGGTVPVPSFATITQCVLVAVCNLSSQETPFYISLIDKESAYPNLQRDAEAYAQQGTFNTNSGLAYIELGEAVVDPATGNVTSWTPNDNATAKKGPDIYTDLSTRITNLEQIRTMYIERKITLPTGTASNPSVTDISFNNDLPAGTKLVGVNITLSNSPLPYAIYGNGEVATWVSHLLKRQITIRNRTSAWNDYTMLAVLFYVVDTDPDN